MIERAENLLEILVVGVCLILSLNRARMTRKKGWLLLGLVYASYLLGDLYWTLYLFFPGRPRRFFMSPNSAGAPRMCSCCFSSGITKRMRSAPCGARSSGSSRFLSWR